MKNIAIKLMIVGCFAVIAGLLFVESTYAQVRIPTTGVAALASQADDVIPVSEAVPPTVPATPKVTPIQYAATPQVQQQVPLSQQVAPQSVAPQQVVPQVQPQLQTATPQLPAMPQTMVQPVMVPEGMSGVIVIPVVVPQYVTYAPPSAAMMANYPVQPTYPQYPAPMMPPMYNPPAMQMMQSQMMQSQMMMQQQMMQQQMMQQQMMPVIQPQAPVQQPIPIKMLLPDGSTVSIKHYMPGKFFKNTVRAVTP